MKLYCDKNVCYFCGLVGEESKSCRSLIEVHHIIERNQKGSNEACNLVACCSTCHSRVHNNIITISGWLDVGYCMKLKWSFKGKEYLGFHGKLS